MSKEVQEKLDEREEESYDAYVKMGEVDLNEPRQTFLD